MVRQQPRWARLREVLRSGQYGRPLAAQMLLSFFMSNPEDFRSRPEGGGGAVYDLGCYTAMTARYVFEAEPLRVTALAELDRNGVDATTTAILDFGGGRHAAFTVSTAMAASQTIAFAQQGGQYPTQRDRHLRCIAGKGRMGWQKASGYTRRAKAETAISRWKRVIGDGLRAHEDRRKTTEMKVGIYVLNHMLKLGRPKYVRIS